MENRIAPEKEFRSVTLRLGFALILNMLLVIFLLSIPSEIEYGITDGGLFDLTDAQYAAIETLYGALYLLSFMLPVGLFALITPKYFKQPMRLAPRGGTDTFLIVIAGIGIVFSTAMLNSYLTRFVDYSPIYSDEPDTPVAFVMTFIVSCVVPAVCEEFLFRGCVLSNLLPYGKTTAIIGSALMFALMHGNIKQYLYTFCAGLFLGLVYTESGSIFPSMLLHLCNNFFDSAEGKLYDMGGKNGNAVYVFIELCAILAALAAVALLVKRRQGRLFSAGGAVPTRNTVLPVSSNRVKLFFSPTIILTASISVIEALLTLLMALSMQ